MRLAIGLLAGLAALAAAAAMLLQFGTIAFH